MSTTIMVPLDGSALAERALLVAERLARATAGRVVLLRAAGDEHHALARASQYLERVATDLRARGLAIETTASCGHAAEAILRDVGWREASLIVMATHGRSAPGRWLHGSVADEVLRRSPVPVVLVPAEAGAAWADARPAKILVPLDGSDLAEEALGPAETWATRLGAEVVLLQVVPWPADVYGEPGALLVFDPQAELKAAEEYLSSVAARLPGTVRWRTQLGRSVAATIVQAATEEHAGLIVMATHGRGGLTRLVLGSVATGAVQRAPMPLLLVRPGIARSPVPGRAAELPVTAARREG